MDRQSIDLKYISGRGIGSLVAFHRACLYTTVYISSLSSGPRPHRQKTPTDPNGANNPEWDHPIRLYFDSNHHTSSPSPDLILHFDIKTQVPLFGDKLVGSVHVPLANLASEGPTDTLHHVSYQVLDPDGKANGVVSFSYILNYESPPVRCSDPAPVQDSITLHQGSSYPTFLNNNDVEPQEVYSPPQKPRLYPTLDTLLENTKPFVHPYLLSDPIPQVYPPPPLPESKQGLYPVVSTEPVIAYPVQDSGVSGYCQIPRSLVSYPEVEPVSGLASYAAPGYYPPPQAPGYFYQARRWDGRCL